MKKTKLALATALCLAISACESKNVQVSESDTQICGRTIYTYVIDSCEYIGIVRNGSDDILAHKGNCRFCAQRNKNTAK